MDLDWTVGGLNCVCITITAIKVASERNVVVTRKVFASSGADQAARITPYH